MSKVVPFRAVRPAVDFVRKVASLPYDVLSVAEAKRQIKNNPYSFLRVEKAECDLPEETSGQEETVARQARRNLRKMMEERILCQDAEAAFYLYRQQRGSHVQTGIAACVSVEEYATGRIKTHENTLDQKERERTLHIDAVGAQTGPVFLTYRGKTEIDRIVSKLQRQAPEYDFVAEDGVRHTVWVVGKSADVEAIQDAFLSVDALYIADGHHRAAAAARVAKSRNEKGGSVSHEHDVMLAVLFPYDQLRILDYNRAIKGLNGLPEEEFMERLHEVFHVVPNYQEKLPQKIHEFGMYLRGGKWFLLKAREEILQENEILAMLDVSLLQNRFLEPVLGIKNPRTDSRITFIGGAKGASGLEDVVDKEGFTVAFSLFPPTIEQMMTIADGGMVMPPKSTWFEPKLRSGLFVHLID